MLLVISYGCEVWSVPFRMSNPGATWRPLSEGAELLLRQVGGSWLRKLIYTKYVAGQAGLYGCISALVQPHLKSLFVCLLPRKRGLKGIVTSASGCCSDICTCMTSISVEKHKR